MISKFGPGRTSMGGSGALQVSPLFLMMMTMMMVVVVVGAMVESAAVEEVDSEENQEILEEDISSEVEDPTSSEVYRLSPLTSWLIFRRNSNKGDNRRTKGSRRTSKHGLPGPPGPPGPQGPPGPPGPLLPQQQQLIQDLQVKLRDVAGVACLQCSGPPRVSTSFFSRLLQDVTIPRRSLLELQPFRSPLGSEQSLQRGPSFNSSTGRYSAPVSGFYQLTASLFLESGSRVQVRLRDSVRAAICIESLCQSNLAVESVMGVAATGGTFSILLSGTLYLQAGEYVSVFMDNATGSTVTVLQDSLFSGILLGI